MGFFSYYYEIFALFDDIFSVLLGFFDVWTRRIYDF